MYLCTVRWWKSTEAIPLLKQISIQIEGKEVRQKGVCGTVKKLLLGSGWAFNLRERC